MESVDNFLAQIEDILEEAKAVPFSGKVAVDRDAVYEVIDEIRMNMPNEIRDAKKIFENRDKYLRDAEKRAASIVDSAKKDADDIIRDGEAKVTKLVAEHEIYKKALEEGARLVEEAKADAKNIRLNAIDYADEILAKGEAAINMTIENVSKQFKNLDGYFSQVHETLYNNRQELRGGGLGH